jgi:hypothetical protein
MVPPVTVKSFTVSVRTLSGTVIVSLDVFPTLAPPEDLILTPAEYQDSGSGSNEKFWLRHVSGRRVGLMPLTVPVPPGNLTATAKRDDSDGVANVAEIVVAENVAREYFFFRGTSANCVYPAVGRPCTEPAGYKTYPNWTVSHAG